MKGVWTVALLIALSALAAMLASNALWGFFWVPPSIRFADHAIPEGIAWFENAGVAGRDPEWSDVEARQNAHVNAGLKSCSMDVHAFSDCTFGRILVRNGASRDWLAASSLRPVERDGQLNIALQCLRTMGVADEAPYFGVLGRATSTSGVHWAFVSAETTNKNARRMSGERRHVECAWRENEGGRSFESVTYRYDVAGIEFLTVEVMTSGFGIVALMFYGAALATRSVLGPKMAQKG